MTTELVTLEIKQQIAYVCLNRPDKMNALNFDMFVAIDKMIKKIAKNRSINAVIVYGAEGNFSSGLDVKSLSKQPSKAVSLLFKFLPGNANLAQRVSIGWQRLPVPVIAVLQGCCFGGGVQIALGADMRIAEPSAKLSIMEAKWGLVPDMAGLASLRQLMSKDKALQLTYSAQILTAEQALNYGLVSEVCDTPMARAEQLAAQFLQTSPDAIAAIKHSINRSWSASIRQLLSRESLSQVALLVGKNCKIAAIRQTSKPDKAYIARQRWW
ncbi:crotonase/enoyl-CoA hydratase family protein [Shewanella aestuarii]|uniref:Crotonase/enoyl-CoA hydratase family protein n=1 Tax=Shewanella aestuarii TaxID=1028752 RepID=A0A6G9QMS9_9GAMM|nr:crotonase/enoyl-CoA hydratase family protein [Shewanella aestuarii]QIR15708.1 crotonase/enoyl-CoA hydratase family protein [Shewanella aestuarii]